MSTLAGSNRPVQVAGNKRGKVKGRAKLLKATSRGMDRCHRFFFNLIMKKKTPSPNGKRNKKFKKKSRYLHSCILTDAQITLSFCPALKKKKKKNER